MKVLLLMKAGDSLEKHSALGPIPVSVREDGNRFATPGETVETGTRKVLACDAGVRHSVEALDAAVCFIGLVTGGGEQDRTRSSAARRAPRGGVYQGLVSYGDVAARRATNGGGAST